ncbi:MAG: hypothetical protein A2Z19_00515 [Deltaproteobacteria bacterium RBG_16_54_18]|nr:MAG: hypothetical protein A2Z19_00515 [Deltaproteobacteria bacterium RBG_16_54_18]
MLPLLPPVISAGKLLEEDILACFRRSSRLAKGLGAREHFFFPPRPRGYWLKATDLKATDLKATDLKATDLKATDLKATDLKATDLKATFGFGFWPRLMASAYGFGTGSGV